MSTTSTAQAPTTTTAPPPTTRHRLDIPTLLLEGRAFLALLVIFAVFSALAPSSYPTVSNVLVMASHVAIYALLAMGMLMVILNGGIDLSVGSIVAFTGAMSAIMLVKWGLPAIVVVPLAILMGAIMGAAQGYWVAYQKIPSFIVTLAGMLVFRGMTYVVLSGRPVGPFPKEFQVLSTGFVPDFLSITDPSTSLIKNYVALVAVLLLVGYAVYAGLRERRLNAVNETENEPFGFFAVQMAIIGVVAIFIGFQLSTYRGLPNVLVIMGLLIALYAFITTRTTIGRRIYAMGGNEKAAKLSGINTERLTFYTFVNMGALAALAGMIIAARLNSATPKAGVGFELDVIAACFIGGASASGGVGKITGAVIGAFIMGVMNNGMSIMGIGIDYQQLIKGLVLLAAVFFDVYNKNKG